LGKKKRGRGILWGKKKKEGEGAVDQFLNCGGEEGKKEKKKRAFSYSEKKKEALSLLRAEEEGEEGGLRPRMRVCYARKKLPVPRKGKRK